MYELQTIYNAYRTSQFTQPVLYGLIIPNSQLDVKSFLSIISFSFFKVNEIRLVIYPTLDEPIIPNSQLDVKNFLSSFSFFLSRRMRLGQLPIPFLMDSLYSRIACLSRTFYELHFFFFSTRMDQASHLSHSLWAHYTQFLVTCQELF